MESADRELLPVAEPSWKRQRRESSAQARIATLSNPTVNSRTTSSPPWSTVRASSRLPTPRINIARNHNNPHLTTPQRDELSKYIAADSVVLESSGFEELVKLRRGKSDFGRKVKKIKHKAARYLHHLKERGANVVLKTPPWSLARSS